MMQLLELVLYGNGSKKRTVSFVLGEVNIITGKSKSGKSAVGDIIEYCLGGSKCNIADGIVRDNVLWYGLLIQFTTNRMFVARKNPINGQQSTSICYYEIGEDISSPEACTFASNSNTKNIEDIISRQLGISENIHIPDEGQSRDPLEANIRHALFYCFQSQDEVASRSTLFHRQSEEVWIQNAIRDTLPYFLGAVNEQAIALATKRRELDRELRLLQRQINEIEAVSGVGSDHAMRLLSEAETVGLINNTSTINKASYNGLFEALKGIKLKSTSVPTTSMDRLSTLQATLLEKEQELSDIQEGLLEAKRIVGDATAYNGEMEHQKVRLQSIGLFEKIDFETGKCPLCSGDLTPTPPNVEMLKKSIITLDQAINRVTRERPQLKRFIDQQQAQSEKISAEIRCIRAEIDGIYGLEDQIRSIKDLNQRRASVYGRISYWLENSKLADDVDSLNDMADKIKQKITDIDLIISNDTINENVQSALALIQLDMTTWADALQLENPGTPYRLDISKLTVVNDRQRPVELRQMGSGSNWLGAHLITMIALHKLFVEKTRPVPNFLFLDQPSQVYFPEDGSEEDVDMQAVSCIFDFLYQRVAEMQGKMQIIVVDHAKLDDEKFTKHLIEDWRDPDQNLVPKDWYTPANTECSESKEL